VSWHLVPYLLDARWIERLLVRSVLQQASISRSLLLRSLFAIGACGASSLASANARVLPLSYGYETLHPEQVVIEQALDARSAIVIDSDGRRALDPQFRMQFEWGYGVSERVTLGVALVLSSAPGDSMFLEGTKQRLHARIIDQTRSPIEVGVNFEIVEFRAALAVEERLVLQRRWGNFRLISNTGIAEEFPSYHPVVTWIIDQTLGPALKVSDHMHVAAEYWLRVGIGEHKGAPTQATTTESVLMHSDPDIGFDTHHFVGPAITLEWHRFWWSTAAYVRLDPMAAETDFLTARKLNDPYGRIWVRSVLGLTL
jgi:hypothetical protein